MKEDELELYSQQLFTVIARAIEDFFLKTHLGLKDSHDILMHALANYLGRIFFNMTFVDEKGTPVRKSDLNIRIEYLKGFSQCVENVMHYNEEMDKIHKSKQEPKNDNQI